MTDKKRLLVIIELNVEEGPSRLVKDVPSIIAGLGSKGTKP